MMWELGLFSLDKSTLRGDLTNNINISKVGAERLVQDSSVVPSNRARSNGHKLQYKKFHLNTKKNFFTL